MLPSGKDDTRSKTGAGRAARRQQVKEFWELAFVMQPHGGIMPNI